MYFEELEPFGALKPYIRSYFHVQSDSKDAKSFSFPSDGCPGMLINLGDPVLFGTNLLNLRPLSGCDVFGYLSRSFFLQSLKPNQIEIIAIKFLPGSLEPIFGIKSAELADSIVSIDDLWSKKGQELTDRIYSSNSVPDTIELLDVAFTKRLSETTSTTNRLHRALDEIIRLKGQIRIEDLADQAGISRRQIERTFNDNVGITPKRFCRIVRFGNILPQLKSINSTNWANLALSAGYCDQAHFINDWKFFTGRSPLAYLNGISTLEATIMGIL
ncbi:AraC family transcriptional regulator [bacterium]|nr:AraC family transcriptional regulator [bacterium]